MYDLHVQAAVVIGFAYSLLEFLLRRIVWWYHPSDTSLQRQSFWAQPLILLGLLVTMSLGFLNLRLLAGYVAASAFYMLIERWRKYVASRRTKSR